MIRAPKSSRSSAHWLALGLGLWAATAPAQIARAATLVYSNDVLGEIEPCGCRNNPQGGMVRKANLLKRLGDPSTILQLDAGDLLFSTNLIPDALQAQSALQASYVLKAHDLLAHDAAVPGEKDFALGFERFEKLRKESEIRYLAANLVKKNGSQYLEPSRIFEKKQKDGKKLKIAVIGIVGESLDWPKELKTTSAIESAKEQVSKLRKKADIVILLTHQGLEKDQALAAAVPGIDVIVGGHSQSFLQTPISVGSTRIYQSSFRNQYIGVQPLQPPPIDVESHQLLGLDPGYDDPAAAEPSRMAALVSEFKKKVAELNVQEATLVQASTPSKSDGPKFQTFPQCAECHLKQFEFWRKTQHAKALVPLIEAKQAQNKECLSCHTLGLGDPEGFDLVTRLAERRKTEANGILAEGTEPMPIDELDGYLRSVHQAKSLKDPVKLTRNGPPQPLHRSLGGLGKVWTPVQCENCHQPGRDHPFGGAYSKAVQKESCLKCHTAERAPEWYTGSQKQPDWAKIEKKRAMITCPSGDLAPGALD